MRLNRLIASILAAGAVTLLAPPTAGNELGHGSVAEHVLDLTPERLEAFRRTMREFGGLLTTEEAAAAGIYLESSYRVPAPLPGRSASADDDIELRVPPGVQGRDLIAEEQFVIAGREEDYEDAARRWVARRIKGSDTSRHEHRGVTPIYAWDGGPIFGLRKGPISASLRPDGWRVRYTRNIQRLPGWVARVTAGREDGDERVEFTIGRSLTKAASSR